MKLMLIASSLALLAGAALADEVIVTSPPPSPPPRPGVVIEHRSADTEVDQKVVTKRDNCCVTRTDMRSDGQGDSVTRSQTNC